MFEWVTILYALCIEASAITNPVALEDRFKFMKTKPVWAIPLILTMFILGISYMVYAFIWLFSDSYPLKVCGLVLCVMSVSALIPVAMKRKMHPIHQRIDSMVCFVTLSLIAYAKTKGW